MEKPTRHLIRGLVFLLAASLPRTSDAGSVNGTWQGTMTQTVEEFVNGVESGPSTTAEPYTLTMQWTDNPPFGGLVDFNVPLYGGFYETPIEYYPFGPQSASFGGEVHAGGDEGFTQDFNITATYLYIGPDGVIVGGSATADFTFVGIIDADPSNFSTISIFASFQSVPEPSAIVTLALGLLTALVFARSLSRRPSQTRRAPSEGGIEVATDLTL